MPPRREIRDTSADFAADVLCEFMDAAVHATLCRRGLYPSELFERVSLYGTPVQRVRHPDLEKYVAGVVSAMRQWVRTGAARSLSLVVTAADHTPLERHVFHFSLRGSAASAAASLAASVSAPIGAEWTNMTHLAELERQLAEMLNRHAQTDAWLEPLPPGEFERAM